MHFCLLVDYTDILKIHMEKCAYMCKHTQNIFAPQDFFMCQKPKHGFPCLSLASFPGCMVYCILFCEKIILVGNGQ